MPLGPGLGWSSAPSLIPCGLAAPESPVEGSFCSVPPAWPSSPPEALRWAFGWSWGALLMLLQEGALRLPPSFPRPLPLHFFQAAGWSGEEGAGSCRGPLLQEQSLAWAGVSQRPGCPVRKSRPGSLGREALQQAGRQAGRVAACSSTWRLKQRQAEAARPSACPVWVAKRSPGQLLPPLSLVPLGKVVLSAFPPPACRASTWAGNRWAGASVLGWGLPGSPSLTWSEAAQGPPWSLLGPLQESERPAQTSAVPREGPPCRPSCWPPCRRGSRPGFQFSRPLQRGVGIRPAPFHAKEYTVGWDCSWPDCAHGRFLPAADWGWPRPFPGEALGLRGAVGSQRVASSGAGPLGSVGGLDRPRLQLPCVRGCSPRPKPCGPDPHPPPLAPPPRDPRAQAPPQSRPSLLEGGLQLQLGSDPLPGRVRVATGTSPLKPTPAHARAPLRPTAVAHALHAEPGPAGLRADRRLGLQHAPPLRRH